MIEGEERPRHDGETHHASVLFWPRYYFDISDGDGFHRYEIGDDFADFAQARSQAQALLPDIAREELPEGDLHRISCSVRDETVYRGELTFRGTILRERPVAQ